MKVYVFDIDGTICTLTEGDYSLAEPIEARIQKVNKLHAEGHHIIFFTARGMGRHKNNKNLAENQFYEFTVKQLDMWGVRYNELHLGKPAGDIYVDDKGIKDEDFFNA
jgi:capsule biosynthesis phosphatase